MKMIRQGDVLLKKVDKAPEGAKKLNTLTVAYGEVTGHAHKIEVDAGDVQLVEDGQGGMFVSVKGGSKATLKHDEHAPINLEGGCYKVVIQREYDPVKERKVQD